MKQTKLIFLLIATLAFASCGSDEPSIAMPNGILYPATSASASLLFILVVLLFGKFVAFSSASTAS